MKLFRSIDVWKRLSDNCMVRYRCFQILPDGGYCVQSEDYYYLPLESKQIQSLDENFLQLLIEYDPDQRRTTYSTLEEAIEKGA